MTVVNRGVATAVAGLAMALAGCGQAAASPPPSSAAPAVDTTTRVTTAVASDPPASAPRCTADQVTAAASTDRAAYRSGDPVTLRTTLTNHSAQPCSVSVSAHDPGFSVNGGGGEVWRTCGPGQSCPLYQRVVVLPAGSGRTETTAWNQNTCDASSCQGPPPPAGAYREIATWGDLGSASAPFTVG